MNANESYVLLLLAFIRVHLRTAVLNLQMQAYPA